MTGHKNDQNRKGVVKERGRHKRFTEDVLALQFYCNVGCKGAEDITYDHHSIQNV